MSEDRSIFGIKIMKYLLTGVIILVLANIFDYLLGQPFWTITRFINLDYENNISAWYSSFLLTIASLIAFESYKIADKKDIPNYKAFLFFSALLLFMSCDETAQLHETLGNLVLKKTQISVESFSKNSNWVWFGGPIVILLFLFTGLYLKKPFLMVHGAFRYLLIGFIVIIFGGVFLESTTNWLNHENLQWVWNIEILVEETLEMIGELAISYSMILWKNKILSESFP